MKKLKIQSYVIASILLVAITSNTVLAEQAVNSDSFSTDKTSLKGIDGNIAQQGVAKKYSGRDKAQNKKLENDIDAQYAALHKAIEDSDDSFSPGLAEHYFSYGRLLKEAGRWKEARLAFRDALHIEKINHGIYSIEQRPALKALFEIHFEQDESKQFNNYLSRILWIESQHPKLKDTFSITMLNKAGNYYLDRYFEEALAGERSILFMNKADYYFNYIIKHYGSHRLDELAMPYSELAFIAYWQGEMIKRQAFAGSSFREARKRSMYGMLTLKQRQNEQRLFRSENHRNLSIAHAHKVRSETYLKRYLKKATDENNTDEIINAFLSLGDYYYFTGDRHKYTSYYKQAWSTAKTLSDNHPAISAMGKPVELPSFDYAKIFNKGLKSKSVEAKRRKLITKQIDLSFTVNTIGKPSKIRPAIKAQFGDNESLNNKYMGLAKRNLKKINFRPAIIDGEIAAVDDFVYPVNIHLRPPADTEIK